VHVYVYVFVHVHVFSPQASLAGSDFDTVLGVYRVTVNPTSPTINALTLVTSNDECTPTSPQSCAGWAAVGGAYYYLQVSGAWWVVLGGGARRCALLCPFENSNCIQ
jgi:hypothetical protein